MKPKLKDNEGLYFINVHRGDSLQDRRALEYIKSAARWFAVRRTYEFYISYIFVIDEEVESYLSLAFGITKDSQIEIYG